MILRLPGQFWQLSNIAGIARNQENNFSEHLEHFGKLPKKNFFFGTMPKRVKNINNKMINLYINFYMLKKQL
jgi:hypothetical protein